MYTDDGSTSIPRGVKIVTVTLQSSIVVNVSLQSAISPGRRMEGVISTFCTTTSAEAGAIKRTIIYGSSNINNIARLPPIVIFINIICFIINNIINLIIFY